MIRTGRITRRKVAVEASLNHDIHEASKSDGVLFGHGQLDTVGDRPSYDAQCGSCKGDATACSVFSALRSPTGHDFALVEAAETGSSEYRS